MGETRSTLLRRERGKHCDARASECERRAVGEAIQRTHESRRNLNCGWTRTHDALSYLVRESNDHVAVEPKR